MFVTCLPTKAEAPPSCHIKQTSNNTDVNKPLTQKLEVGCFCEKRPIMSNKAGQSLELYLSFISTLAHLHAQFLSEEQGGAQVAGPPHEQLVRAALQEADGRAHLPQAPELAQRLHVLLRAQGLVDERGHRVDARPAEQEGGAHIVVRLRVRAPHRRVDDPLGRLQVRVPVLGEQRALAHVVQHVGHAGRPVVQTSVAVADVERHLLEDPVDLRHHGGQDGLGALAREQRASVVGEAVGEAAGARHHGSGMRVSVVPEEERGGERCSAGAAAGWMEAVEDGRGDLRGVSLHHRTALRPLGSSYIIQLLFIIRLLLCTNEEYRKETFSYRHVRIHYTELNM